MTAAELHRFLPEGEAAAVAGARGAALERFGRTGWPTRRLEAWKHSDPDRFVTPEFEPAAVEPADTNALRAFLAGQLVAGADRVVLVNGRFIPEHSRIGALPPGARVSSFAAWAAEHPAAAAAALAPETGAEGALATLNAALSGDGIVIEIPAGMTLDRPLHLIHWGDALRPAACHLRSVLRLGAGASATIYESWGAAGPIWSNGVALITLADQAVLRHYKLVVEGDGALHSGDHRVAAAEAANYESFTFLAGSGTVRQEIGVVLAGAAARTALDGGYALAGRQEATIVTRVTHEAPHGTTEETFKGVVADRAHGVFQGAISVRPGAVGTDANQLNKTVLLGQRAMMDTKPELEIFADDVKCSHGASVGDLDENALFYLCARGIAPEDARRMLVEAFIADVIERLPAEQARGFFREALARRLAGFGV